MTPEQLGIRADNAPLQAVRDFLGKKQMQIYAPCPHCVPTKLLDLKPTPKNQPDTLLGPRLVAQTGRPLHCSGAAKLQTRFVNGEAY